jgi:hypothetical protein
MDASTVKLFDALVQPILDYGAAVWGVKEYSFINAIHHRACKVFLGLGRSAPTTAILGDMGWRFPAQRQWTPIVRQWLRLATMDQNRMNCKVFKWARGQAILNVKNNSYFFVNYMKKLNMEYIVHVNTEMSKSQRKHYVKEVNEEIYKQCVVDWESDLNREKAKTGSGKNKLRTYRMFKKTYDCEVYVKTVLSRKNRSSLAKMRSGIAPIRLETGRYERITEENRLCTICKNGEIESELHVLTICTAYEDERRWLFNIAEHFNSDFNDMNNLDRMIYLLSGKDIVIQTAKTCSDILTKRFKLTHDVF